MESAITTKQSRNQIPQNQNQIIMATTSAKKMTDAQKLAKFAEMEARLAKIDAEAEAEAIAKAKKEAEAKKTLEQNLKKHNEWNAQNGIPKLDTEIDELNELYHAKVAERKKILEGNPHKISTIRIRHTDPVKRVELDTKKAKANQNYFADEGLSKNYYCLRSDGKDCQLDGIRTEGCKKIYKKKSTRDAHSQICKNKHAKDMEGKL